MWKLRLTLVASIFVVVPTIARTDDGQGSSPSQQSKSPPYFGEVEAEPGFFRTFNGKNLGDWEGQSDSWTVKDGAIGSPASASNAIG